MIPTGLVNATVLKAGAAFVNPGSLGRLLVQAVVKELLLL